MYDFVISDTHFFHDNIIKYAGRPQNHVELMIKEWQDTVRPDQTVLHLGDVLMGKPDLWPLIDELPGKVDVLVSGNHDEPYKRKWLEENWGWTFVKDFQMRYRGWEVYFSHYPLWVDAMGGPIGRLMLDPNWKNVNIHGHIHEKQAPSPFHINVSVEWIEYRPTPLQALLDNYIETNPTI